MKAFKEVVKEIKKTEEKIKTNDAKMEQLTRIFERHIAADNRDFETVKRLREEVKANEDEINKTAEEKTHLRIALAILKDNAKAAFFEEFLPVFTDIMQPYNGKKYGEKTREKIREAAHAAGIGFYFDNRSGAATTIVAYPLSADGYRHGSDFDIRINSNYNTPFITEENKITTGENGAYIREKYTDNPKARAAEILKAFEKAKKAAAAAEKAQSEYNAIIPAAMKNINTCDDHFYMF